VQSGELREKGMGYREKREAVLPALKVKELHDQRRAQLMRNRRIAV